MSKTLQFLFTTNRTTLTSVIIGMKSAKKVLTTIIWHYLLPCFELFTIITQSYSRFNNQFSLQHSI